MTLLLHCEVYITCRLGSPLSLAPDLTSPVLPESARLPSNPY